MLLDSSACLTICRPPVCLWIRSPLDQHPSNVAKGVDDPTSEMASGTRCQHRHNQLGALECYHVSCLCHTSGRPMACWRALAVRVHVLWWHLELVGALRVRRSAPSAQHRVSALRLAPAPPRVKPRM